MRQVISRTVTRRALLKVTAAAGALLAGAAAGLPALPVRRAAARQNVDPAFSDTLIHGFGYPEVTVSTGPDGTDAPAELPAGLTVITLTAPEGYDNYLDIVTVPDGFTEDELIEQGLAAGSGDVPQAGWVYHGGTNTPGAGKSATFIIDLKPGAYRWALSYYAQPAEGEEFVEPMVLPPLTITAGGATATPAEEPVATVTLEETDNLQYIVTPDPVPTGPQIWKITNTGMHHPHHMVMVRIPEGTTAQDIIGEFNQMFAATPTPPSEDSIFATAIWTAYAALQSGGATTWAEFDLKPATYAVICFIFNPETMRPHAADGMVTVFTVE